MAIPHLEVDVYEPLTASPQRRPIGDLGTPIPMVFLHLYESCRSVQSAVARDGEVLKSRGYLDEVLDRTPKMTLCSWCAKHFMPPSGFGRWWE